MKHLHLLLATVLLAPTAAPAAPHRPDPRPWPGWLRWFGGLTADMRACLPEATPPVTLVVSGTCAAEGTFALVLTPVQVARAGSTEQARLEAQRELARFLSNQVESETTSGSSTSSTTEDRDVRVTAERWLEQHTRSGASVVLNGLELLEVVRDPVGTYLVFGLTTSSMDRAGRLASLATRPWSAPETVLPGDPRGQAHEASAPGTTASGGERVEALGVAPVVDGNVALALREARADAERNAVEQVRGALVISRSSWHALGDGPDAGSSEQRGFSLSRGTVHGTRVLEERTDARDGFVRVRIETEVREADYRACFDRYLAAVGQPRFHVEPGSELSQGLREALVELGLRVVERPEDADFLVRSEARFVTTEHPLRRTQVTRLDPTLSIVRAVDGELVATPALSAPVSADGRDPELHEDTCLRRFRTLVVDPLRESLGALAQDYAEHGRPVQVRVRAAGGADLGGLRADLTRRIGSLPGVLRADPRWDAETLVVELRTFRLTADLDRVVQDEILAALDTDAPWRLAEVEGGPARLDYTVLR